MKRSVCFVRTEAAGEELPAEQPAEPAAHGIDDLWGAPPAPAPSATSGDLTADVRAALLQVEANTQPHRDAQNRRSGDPSYKTSAFYLVPSVASAMESPR